MDKFSCRFCDATLSLSFCDLGISPLANSYIESIKNNSNEKFYPLHTYVCQSCYLVQLPEYEIPENIFSDYIYFSSYSRSWLAHAKQYVDNIMQRYTYNKDSLIIEIASNDGYLLQYFNDYDVRAIGVEPATNVARVANKKGVKTINKFFNINTANQIITELKCADLIIANNVLAHVSNIKDFVESIKILLAQGGVVTIEFPHLLNIIKYVQFDTIYHEHYSYFSLSVVKMILEKHDLRIFDVEKIMTHGGSLRVYACHKNDSKKMNSENINIILDEENKFGMTSNDTYKLFSNKVKNVRKKITSFLIEEKSKGANIIGYGAAAKGNTLLNYCKIGTDLIDYIVDKNHHKQGKYLPGSHIPIHSIDKVIKTKPNYIFILPWNIYEEIIEQMQFVRDWGCKFIILIPELKIIE